MTKQNKNAVEIFSDEYLKLNDKMRMAVDMRLEGFKLTDITKALNENGLKVAYETVRWYFQKTGPCFKAYEKMRNLRALDRQELIAKLNDELEDIAIDAVMIIKQGIRDRKVPAGIKIPAAFKVLETIGYEPKKKLNDEENPTVNITFTQLDNVKVSAKPNRKHKAINKTK